MMRFHHKRQIKTSRLSVTNLSVELVSWDHQSAQHEMPGLEDIINTFLTHCSATNTFDASSIPYPTLYLLRRDTDSIPLTNIIFSNFCSLGVKEESERPNINLVEGTSLSSNKESSTMSQSNTMLGPVISQKDHLYSLIIVIVVAVLTIFQSITPTMASTTTEQQKPFVQSPYRTTLGGSSFQSTEPTYNDSASVTANPKDIQQTTTTTGLDFLDDLRSKYSHQPVFLQSVEEIAVSLLPLFDDAENGEFYKRAFVSMTEPERTISFRVSWEDDNGVLHFNRGWRVEFSR
jgi:hypothetical protein